MLHPHSHSPLELPSECGSPRPEDFSRQDTQGRERPADVRLSLYVGLAHKPLLAIRTEIE